MKLTRRFTEVHEAAAATAGPTMLSWTSNTFQGRRPSAAPRPIVHLMKSRRAWSGISMYRRRVAMVYLLRLWLFAGVRRCEQRRHRQGFANLSRRSRRLDVVVQVHLGLRR